MLLRKITLGRLSPVSTLCCSRCHGWRVVSSKFIDKILKKRSSVFWQFQMYVDLLLYVGVLLRLWVLHLLEQTHFLNSINAGTCTLQWYITMYKFCGANWDNSHVSCNVVCIAVYRGIDKLSILQWIKKKDTATKGIQTTWSCQGPIYKVWFARFICNIADSHR